MTVPNSWLPLDSRTRSRSGSTVSQRPSCRCQASLIRRSPCSRHAGVQPRRTVIVESTPAGAAAGRRGAFGLVIGLDRTGRPEDLLAAGANVVVSVLDEIAVPTEWVTVR